MNHFIRCRQNRYAETAKRNSIKLVIALSVFSATGLACRFSPSLLQPQNPSTTITRPILWYTLLKDEYKSLAFDSASTVVFCLPSSYHFTHLYGP